MAEIRTVTTLKRKRDEIARSIAVYEKKIAQAKADLAHVNGAIRIFEQGGEGAFVAPYVDIYRMFKRGEMAAICREALAAGPQNTRQLAQHVRGRRVSRADVLAVDVQAHLVARPCGDEVAPLAFLPVEVPVLRLQLLRTADD
jgi:hypothetical protein